LHGLLAVRHRGEHVVVDHDLVSAVPGGVRRLPDDDGHRVPDEVHLVGGHAAVLGDLEVREKPPAGQRAHAPLRQVLAGVRHHDTGHALGP
jgi:hypothetical protein